MDTMIMAALTAGTPAALGELVASLPFDRVEAYETDGGRLLVGRVGSSVLSVVTQAECGCGDPGHDNGFKITVLACGTVESADETIRRNLDTVMETANMLSAVTGQSTLRPITVGNLAMPLG
jgi:hypothetical protein